MAPAQTAATRPATPADADALAELHCRTLPAEVSHFTPLGRRLVRRFYANALSRGVASGQVAEVEGVPAGFVLITPDIGTLFPRALLAGPGDVLAFLLAARPLGLLRSAWIKLNSGTVTVASAPELVYIGVDDRFRGRGVGAALMEAAEAAFRAAGVPAYQLNVRADNEAAVRLYTSRGMRETRRFVEAGRTILTLTKPL